MPPLCSAELASVRAEPLAGGFMGPVLRVALSDGRSVVAKGGASPPREAEMLRALTAAGAPTPAVLAVDERALVLEACPADGSHSRAPGATSARCSRGCTAPPWAIATAG
jgi:hypothetical protein